MRMLPGDVALVIVGGEGATSAGTEQLEQMRADLGLKDPWPVQYGRWVWTLVFPGGALSIAVLCFSYLGDALRDALDLRLRR